MQCNQDLWSLFESGVRRKGGGWGGGEARWGGGEARFLHALHKREESGEQFRRKQHHKKKD